VVPNPNKGRDKHLKKKTTVSAGNWVLNLDDADKVGVTEDHANRFRKGSRKRKVDGSYRRHRSLAVEGLIAQGHLKTIGSCFCKGGDRRLKGGRRGGERNALPRNGRPWKSIEKKCGSENGRLEEYVPSKN